MLVASAAWVGPAAVVVLAVSVASAVWVDPAVGGVGGIGGVGKPGGAGVNRPSTLPAQGGPGQNGLSNWTHNPVHRGGTPYSDRATAARFGGSAGGDSLAQRQAGARQHIARQGGTLTSKPAAGGGLGSAGNAGLGNRAGAVGTANRAGGAGRGAGGGDRIGGRDLSRGSAGDRNAFGGGSRGFNGSSARSNSNRGFSSMRPGGGGYESWQLQSWRRWLPGWWL